MGETPRCSLLPAWKCWAGPPTSRLPTPTEAELTRIARDNCTGRPVLRGTETMCQRPVGSPVAVALYRRCLQGGWWSTVEKADSPRSSSPTREMDSEHSRPLANPPAPPNQELATCQLCQAGSGQRGFRGLWLQLQIPDQRPLTKHAFLTSSVSMS